MKVVAINTANTKPAPLCRLCLFCIGSALSFKPEYKTSVLANRGFALQDHDWRRTENISSYVFDRFGNTFRISHEALFRIALKTFETPAAGLDKLFGIFLHDADDFTTVRNDGIVARFGLIDNQKGSFAKTARRSENNFSPLRICPKRWLKQIAITTITLES